MKQDEHNTSLGCSSCHGGHSFDLKQAAVESCSRCHGDQHTKAYKNSPHSKLWQQQANGLIEAGRGVSCASCHMPRLTSRREGYERVLVQHNQNFNLRPNEKMLRDVCMQCHGYQFSVSALADETLINNNFAGKPTLVIKSVEMAVERERNKKAKDS